ncbi:MAG: helix-turn-helix domain-containing protein [Minisyncoccia bacterium]
MRAPKSAFNYHGTVAAWFNYRFMIEKGLKKKIDRHENDGELLEAFLLQSAAIESLLFAEIKLNLSAKSGDLKAVGAVEKQISDYPFPQLIEFLIETGWLPKEKIDLVHHYQGKRNGILRNLTGHVPRKDFEKKLNEAYYIGKIILSFPEFSGNKKVSALRKRRVPGPVARRDRSPYQLVKKEGRTTEREDTILKLRLGGDTYEEIGNKIGVTKERVRQILNAAISKIEGTVHKLRHQGSATETNAKVNNLKEINIKNILSTVCRTYNISQNDLLGTSRLARLVFPRQLTIYFLRKNLKLSFPQIAKIMRRDHTTAMHAYGKIERLMKLEKIFIAPPRPATR